MFQNAFGKTQVTFISSRDQKREAIRRAALRLFRARGFRKVTIREIAREADVSQVTIYNHFGSKEELVRDTVKNLMFDMVTRYRELIEGPQPFLEKLQDIFLSKMGVFSQYEGELVQRVVSDDPLMQKFIKRIYDREIKPMIVRFFDEGKRQGYVNPGLSEEAILVYTEILRSGLVARPELLSGSRKSARMIRELMTLYLYGLMGKSELRNESQVYRKGEKHGR